ncbi:PTS mannose/fructose/sorbose/N-acetylgalactosamine transporter subunit IIC [Schleiferilactobacillus harbinensis]|uniref:PTS sugar transporter subunit IIC n=1 Tax=Schleiferilactobacillus harbinensis TaxID=304207 RepID=A0A5P8M819_9LACO|nr:PTS sugar transporter subunit IIC [Schleiferilactobacillus harbinensis]QFR24678.1 PTS sugar transporter subunit IIC [Schleiferilactobacillus harbinensis]
MFVNALMVGLALTIQKFGDWYGSLGFNRPMVAGTIVGILLGHPTQGIMIGAALELVYLGSISLGGVMPQDFGMGSVFGTAFGILLSSKTSVAIALSLPISMLGTLVYQVFKIWATALVPRFEVHLKEHNIKAFNRLWQMQRAVYLGMWFVLGFVGIMAGTNAIKALVNAIPQPIMNGLTVAAGMLPAVGIALLMITLWNRNLAPWFFLGFAVVSFFKGTMIEVAFIGICIAMLVAVADLANRHKGSNDTPTTNGASASDEDVEEDFLND